MTRAKTPVRVPRKAYSMADAGNAYGVGPKTIAEAVHSGQLRAKWVGGQMRIDEKALDDWFNSLPDV